MINNDSYTITELKNIVKYLINTLKSLDSPDSDIDNNNMLVELFNTTPDVIKIDIEGSEYQALLGAYNTIMKSRPIIFIEIHPKFLNLYQNNINQIVEFVSSIDYKVYDLNQNEVTNYIDKNCVFSTA